MKKYIAIILTVLMLISCESSDFAQEIPRRYKEMAGIRIEAEISAEFNDRTDKYTVLYSYQKGSNATVKVLKPEEIAGIEATIDEDAATFRFKDTILETGMDINSPTPMNVLHKLVQVWSFKEVTQTGSEGDNTLLVYDDGDYQYRTVFNDDYLPICAEIMRNSKLKMKIDFIKCEGTVNAD